MAGISWQFFSHILLQLCVYTELLLRFVHLIMIYSYIFGAILAAMSYLVYQRYLNVYLSVITKTDKRYDYIIAGAGTSGCVLAARLSEDPKNKVLLIEAGEHMSYFTKIPLTATAAQQGTDDWSVKTTSQRFSSFGLWGQTQILPRGKGLGGSGQINFLLHGFGLPEDYDKWDSLSFGGWSYNDLSPYFTKAFGTVESEFDSKECLNCPGSMAPMQLRLINEDDALMNTFRRASEEATSDSRLFRKSTATIKEGVRYSSLDAYLKPAMNRKNLHVLLKTQAISIRFENKTAASVFILKNHRELNNIFADKEIILCTGAIKTPQILMLSGIGPADVLKKLRIPAITENRYVGRNLHDHMNMPIYISIKEQISVTLSKVFSVKTIWDYIWNGAGLLSFPPVGGVEYQNNTAVLLFSMGSTSERLLRDLSNYKPQVYRDTFPFHSSTHKEGFMFLATCTQPESRGFVTLLDTRTTVPVVVDPHYLQSHSDVKCMVQAIRRIESLISTKAFRSIGAKIHWPRPERCLSFWNYSLEDQKGIKIKRKKISTDKPSSKKHKISATGSPPDAYVECLIREVAVTGHHIAGTCSGGTVVDNDLRVKGVSGLRVIDASILPSPVSLFPNSVLIGIAEKAADIILNS